MYLFLSFCLAALAESKSGPWLATHEIVSEQTGREDPEAEAVLSMLQTGTAVHHHHAATSNALQTASVQELSPQRHLFRMAWVVPPNDPKDWLFGVVTTECKPEVVHDNQSDSILSRLFIPALMLFSVGAMVRLGSLSAMDKSANGVDAKGSDKTADNLQGPAPDPESSSVASPPSPGTPFKPGERLWHVDFARISAVVCVIFEHCGGMAYSRRNMAFGLYWTMPYMFMTCGVSILMSKSSMMGYILRLAILFAVGFSVNLTADIYTGRDWRHDPMNTIFQMMFVIMLIVMAFLTETLRQALLFRKSNPNARARKGTIVAMFIWGFFTAVGLVSFIQAAPLLPFTLGGDFGDFYASLTTEVPLFLIEFCGFVFLCHFISVLGAGQNTGYIGWLLMPFLYLPGIVVPWHQDCFARWLNLYVFAMVTYVWPLQGQERVVTAMRSYWPFFMMILCLIAMPNMTGRCDMFPPGMLWERCRERTGEILMTICFVTAAFKVSDPWNITVWMGKWSLFAYCFHLGFYRVLGSPYGPALTFSFIPFFYFLHVMFSKPPSDDKATEKISS
mmetsp:Transcript_113003/g.200269  ORF Transcript_113003/g.200269 Transcript_113003/m.200269 type:complete len:561 (-) Transcript_113003:75-1757(-)